MYQLGIPYMAAVTTDLVERRSPFAEMCLCRFEIIVHNKGHSYGRVLSALPENCHCMGSHTAHGILNCILSAIATSSH